jgi:DnaK suppressor protein
MRKESQLKRKTTKKSVPKKKLKKAVAKKVASKKSVVKKIKPKGKANIKNTKKALKGIKSLKKSALKKPAAKATIKKLPVKKSAAVKKAETSVKPKLITAKTKQVVTNPNKIVAKPVPPPPVMKPLKRYKPNAKTRYTPKELKHFKDIILEERRKIIQSAKANMEALVDDESGEYVGDNATYATHMAEQGSDEMEREKNYMFVQRDEKYLGYLEEALIRIDAGTYGVCIDCFDTPKNLCRTCPLIDPERLELVPVTQHCIECKNLRGMVNY